MTLEQKTPDARGHEGAVQTVIDLLMKLSNPRSGLTGRQINSRIAQGEATTRKLRLNGIRTLAAGFFNRFKPE